MKVLFLAPHMSTGGMPAFVLKRIESILKYYPNVEVFCIEFSSYSPTYVVQKKKILDLIPKENFWLLGSDKMELIDIIKKHQFDIIHVDEILEGFDTFNQVPLEVLNSLYDKNRTWKIIETCHNVWFNPTQNKRFNPDGYMFCTPFHLSETFAQMPSEKIVVEYPIEDLRVSIVEKNHFKKKLGLDKNKVHVLNVGLWTPGKNQKEGVEIARLLEYSNPEIQFHFVGNYAENFATYWEPIFKDLPSNVKIWNEQSNIDEFLKSTDIFMFNSVWECNPLVLREASSYGMKILARNLPQYLDMFTKFITPIDDDLEKTKNLLLNLVNTKVEYEIPKNQERTFAEDHINFYQKIKSLPIIYQKPISSEVTIHQHFVNQPFLEIKGNSDKKYLVEFFDEEGTCHYRNELSSNSWVKLNREYYTKWTTKVYENNRLIYNNTLNYENKKVFISFDSHSLGDTIAWIPYCLEFKNKHNCHVIVACKFHEFFAPVYPEIEFVPVGSTVHNLYGMYKLGWFYNTDKEPVAPNLIPLQKTATNILGLDYTEIKPRIKFPLFPKPTKHKYITIATHSTAGLKYWNNVGGWQTLVDYLVSRGYKIIHVSKEKTDLKNVTQLQDCSLENTMSVIHHSEFFIGLSSGLSWLSWAVGKHVFMISNFSEKNHEFTIDCTRIFNPFSCNGCWNNPNHKFDRGDWNWCPEHKDTARHFECHKTITPEMVVNVIEPYLK